MKWLDVKEATLQKMFSMNGNMIPSDDSTRDYLVAMPNAANEGILMLSTAGKFLVKSFSIAVQPMKNLLTDQQSMTIHSCVAENKEFEAENAHSFYFEVTGRCTLTITVGETVSDPIEFDTLNAYIIHKQIVENADGAIVKLSFTSDYPYAIKNIAMYEATYMEDTEVPDFAEKIRYKATDLAEDFYTINSIYFEGEIERYIKTDEVYQEGDKTLVLDRDIPGNYIVYYNALPVEITAGTEDDYELPLDREVAALLPLYMASELYKEDDISIATSYRNEFEVGFERLQNSQPSGKAEKVVSESGWI